MHAVYEIKIPQLGVNDDFAMLVEWLVSDRAKVSKGDPICIIETTKVATELTAEESGFIFMKAMAGEQIRIRDTIGYISDSCDYEIPVSVQENNEKVADTTKNVFVAKKKITNKARALADSLGINISSVEKIGIIREKDIKAFIEKKKTNHKQRIAIYGAGRGGLTIKECVELMGGYEVGYFIDDNPNIGSEVEGIQCLSGDRLEEIKKNGVVGVASEIANSEFRLNLRGKLKNFGLKYINVVHPKAFIAPSVTLGEGVFIKAGAIIETNTIIGDCCIIDNGVMIAHDNIIEEGCHLAPGVSLGSNIEIRNQTIVGIGACISTKVKIGSKVIIGVGSSVTRDIPDNSVVEGVPGKIIGKRK